MWGNLKTDYTINQKGQAILELATFGSVLLFCLALLIHFGMQMNYQQNAQMQAFRKGQRLAYYKQGPSSLASLSVLKDKPAIDPRDRWGFADRVTVGGSATIAWSNTLNGLFVNDISETPDDRDMSRTYIEVNKKTDADRAQVTDGRGLADSEINDNLDKNRVGTQAKGVFTTAGWERVPDIQGYSSIGVYLEDSKHEYGTREYYPLEINPQDIKVFEDPSDPQQKSAAYQFAGLRRTLSSAVLIRNADELNKFRNGESRPVSIIAVKGDKGNECDKDNYCGKLTEILIIKLQLGEIDSYYVDVRPWDKDKSLSTKQGLLLGSEKKLEHGSGTKMTVTGTAEGISTKTESAATQEVIHNIRLNNGKVVAIPVKFKPVETYNYEVR